MRRTWLWLAVLGWTGLTGLPAQSVVEFPLGSLPQVPLAFGTEPAPILTSPDGFALIEAGVLHTVTGLPTSAQHQSFALTGSLEPAQAWVLLAATAAVYPSQSGFLVLVRGLPHTPTVTTTNFAHPPEPFVRVNDTTAVARDPTNGRFEVLRWGDSGASLVSVPAPSSLASGPGFVWGRSGDDGYFGVGPGQDAVSGTPDDQIVYLTGLSGPTQQFLAFSSFLPPGTGPKGFVITDVGIGAYWEALTSLSIAAVTLVTQVGTNVATLSFGVPVTGSSPGTAGPTPLSVRPVSGGGLDVVTPNDVSLGHNHSFVHRIAPDPNLFTWQPELLGGYEESDNEVIALASNEIVITGGFGYPPHRLRRLPGSSLETLFWTQNLYGLRRPNDRTVIAFGIGSEFTSSVTILFDPFTSPGVLNHNLGHFAQAPLVLGRGRVAWLGRPRECDPIDRVVCLTLPYSAAVGTAGFSEPSWLSVWPSLPRADAPVHLQAWPPTLGPVTTTLFASDRILDPPIPATSLGLNGYSAPLRLDPEFLWPASFPLLGAPFGEVILPAGSLPAELRGREIYIQGLFESLYDGAGLSHTLLLTIG